jgi:hypothetical protein
MQSVRRFVHGLAFRLNIIINAADHKMWKSGTDMLPSIRLISKLFFLSVGFWLSTISYGKIGDSWKRYSSEAISFYYPSFLYGNPTIESQDDETRFHIVEIVNIRRKAVDGVDSITVCKHKLEKCASIRDFDKPYWLEEASGRLILFNPTELFVFYKNKFGSGYEAFPMCGWVDKHGVPSQYGGQCYVIVVSNGRKTISFNFLLGQNVGVRLLNAKYQKRINMYRRIAESAR